MSNRLSGSRAAWLIVGILAGVCIAYFWPHEPISAAATDRTDKFAMATVIMEDDLEAVFAMDFLTGRLTGAVLNNQGNGFAAYYFRDIATDFKVDPGAKPNYTVLGGRAFMQQRGSAQWASSVVYIGELTSGRIAGYAVPYRTMNRKVPKPIELVPLDVFSFRGAMLGD